MSEKKWRKLQGLVGHHTFYVSLTRRRERERTRKFIRRNNGRKLHSSEEGNGHADPRSPKVT